MSHIFINIFKNYRYEPPDSKNRWDHPLFAVTPEDELKCEAIYSTLYRGEVPKPNMSTQCVSNMFTHHIYTSITKII